MAENSSFSTVMGQADSDDVIHSFDDDEVEQARELDSTLPDTNNSVSYMGSQVLEKIVNKLCKVKISKKDVDEFQRKLRGNLVDSWEEKSVCKHRSGIPVEKFERFLEMFKKTTGVSEDVIEDLRQIEFCDDMEEQVKSFKMETNACSGRYGMIALACKSGKIDLMYTIYTVSFKMADKVEEITKQKSLFGILFGKMEKETRRTEFKFGFKDVNRIQENYIRGKALQSFCNEGLIPSINYVKSLDECESQD